jgi:Caspase domain
MKPPGSSKLRQFFLAAALLLLVCQPAFAEKRVALVLGNSAYQNVARLANPVNDGAMIAATLKNAGFDVVEERHDYRTRPAPAHLSLDGSGYGSQFKAGTTVELNRTRGDAHRARLCAAADGKWHSHGGHDAQ